MISTLGGLQMGLSARLTIVLGSLALLAGARQAAAQTPQAPTVTVGGTGYFQYGYSFNEDSSLKTLGGTSFGHANNFDVTRAYININAKLPHGVGVRITPDIITSRNNTVTGLVLRMKYAYVSWTPTNSPLTFKFGEIQTPWLDWEEALWDYRMQGQMAMERAGYFSSSDFGFSVDGNIHYDKLNFTAGVYNGENYSAGGLGDQRKDFSARVSYKILNTDLPGKVGGLRITGYGQYGKPTTGGERYRAVGELSYQTKMFLLAAEYGWAQDSVTGDSVGAANSKPQATGQVLSFYGVLRIPNSAWQIIARYDRNDPNTASTSPDNTQNRFIGGVAYQVSTNLRVMAGVDLASTPGAVYKNTYNASRSLGLLQAQVVF
jgi:hypothetical protein